MRCFGRRRTEDKALRRNHENQYWRKAIFLKPNAPCTVRMSPAASGIQITSRSMPDQRSSSRRRQRCLALMAEIWSPTLMLVKR